MNTIYEFITSQGILSPEHNQELKIKRGFTDETIKERRLFSGGKYLLGLEAELLGNFKSEDLIQSGVFTANPNSPKITFSPGLVENRIIIPYIKGDKITLLRPHKMGLKDTPIQVYETNWLSRDCILTEGEFKAMAAAQLGFTSIAIPGIGSFSDKHFPELIKLLNEHGIRCVSVIFDSEDKADPKLKNYKPNPSHRFDTQYYAYLMAKMLEREGKDARVGILPDSWRVEGKADIDGSLAQGKTREDFENVILSSLSAENYCEDLPKEAQKIIRKKKDRRYFRSHIHVEHGCYIAMRWDARKKDEYPEEISNFTIKISAYNYTSEGLVRDIIYISKDGEHSKPYSITADQMNNDSWKTFCFDAANYVWKGRPEDLMTLWESEFINSDETRFIYEPDHIGWCGEDNMWIFGNIAVSKDGKESRPDENGIFWTDNKGIRPVPIVVTTGKNQTDTGIPSINLNEFNIEDFRLRLADTIGEMQANVACGWVNACFYLEEVFKMHGCFPFLFLRGLKGSGKTKIATWLTSFFGIEGEGYQIEGTTAVGAGRYLGYYSSLPVLFDDYRNNDKVQNKDGFFRNVYNRQSAGKGMKQNYGVREQKIRGTILFTGEETPHDGALMERCVPIFVSEKMRVKNHLHWFSGNRTLFSGYAYSILRAKPKKLEVFTRVLNESFNYFESRKLASRTSVNYAIICAGYAVGFGENNVDFARWVTAETARSAEENRSESQVSMFFNDVLALRVRGRINGKYWDVCEGNIYLYLHGLYNEWAEDYRKRRGEPPFKESAIRDYLKDEPGFLQNMKNWRIGNTVVSSTVFLEESAPETLRSIVQELGGEALER